MKFIFLIKLLKVFLNFWFFINNSFEQMFSNSDFLFSFYIRRAKISFSLKFSLTTVLATVHTQIPVVIFFSNPKVNRIFCILCVCVCLFVLIFRSGVLQDHEKKTVVKLTLHEKKKFLYLKRQMQITELEKY